MKRTTLQQLDFLTENRAVYTIDKLRWIKSITSIEGCIGTGKSTHLQHMKEWAQENGRAALTITRESPSGDYYLFVGEPTGPWEEPIYHTGRYGDPPVSSPDQKKPILKRYYEDPENIAFPFQIFAFTTRICAVRDVLSDMRDVLADAEIVARILSGEIRIHIICERSLRTDALFMYCQYLLRNVNALELAVYDMLHSTTCDALLQAHTGMVYVHTPLEMCALRIKERNRDGEDRVSISYQTLLEQQHGIMVQKFGQTSETHRVYRVDASHQMTYSELRPIAHELMVRIDSDLARLQ